MKLIRIVTDDSKSFAQYFDFEAQKNGIQEEECYKDIEQISSNDVICILQYIIDNDDGEIDLFEEGKLQNPAQNMIYKELYNSFNEVITNRKDLKDKIDEEFKAIEEQYINKE